MKIGEIKRCLSVWAINFEKAIIPYTWTKSIGVFVQKITIGQINCPSYEYCVHSYMKCVRKVKFIR